MQALCTGGGATQASLCPIAASRAMPFPRRRQLLCAVQHAPGNVGRGAEGRSSSIARAKPRKVSAEELEVELANRDVPMVVDFYATWCGPCVLLAKELETVAEDLGDAVKVLKVDTDENLALATQLQIQGLPTMVFVGRDPSKPALRTEGMLPAQTIKDIVTKEIS